MEETTMTELAPEALFAHYNLNEIEEPQERQKTKFEAIDTAEYTLQVDSLQKTTLQIKNGKKAGTTSEVVKAVFTVLDHPQYTNRKLFHTFFPSAITLQELQKLGKVTGMPLTDPTAVEEWANQFVMLDPPAKLVAFVKKEAPYNNPQGDPINNISFRYAKPAA